MIEPILHQIFHPLTCPAMPPEWERFSRGWRRLHPGHRYVLWGAEESRNFVSRHHPDFLSVYEGYTSPMKRVASLRYLLLQHFGGMVVDLDLECLRSVEPLLQDRRLVLAVEPVAQWHPSRQEKGQPVLSTAFLASEAGHPFWSSVLEELQESAGVRGFREGAGNLLLTRCCDATPERTGITLLPPDAINPVDALGCESGSALDLEQWIEATQHAFAVHHWAGTWNRPGPNPLPAARAYLEGLPARLHHPAWRGAHPGRLFASGPLVSCIMVTRGWSFPARWAIQSFCNQSYSNRELVVATTNPNGDLRAHIESLGDPRIRLLDPLPAGMPLGAQRNAAVKASRGDLVCTWDDDDLYGADRIAAQFTAMAATGGAAAFLDRISVWWPARQHLAITSRRPWENTMLAQRAVLKPYPEVDRAEDTQVVDALVSGYPVATVDDPNLYVYVAWGTNTWGADHFQKLLRGATYQVGKLDYDRALSVVNRHVPILEYLRWLQERDPRSFDPPPDSPAQLGARPPTGESPRPPQPDAPGTSRIVPARSALAAAGNDPLRFLLAWELGAGFGHTVPLGQIARPLLEAGHEVHLVLRDLSTMRTALGRLATHPRLRVWQSPHWGVPFHGSGDPISFAEILFRAGYLDAHRLMGLVDGWETLFRQVQPHLLLAEHAPTALLAARAHRFPRAQVGSGFFVPLLETPIPSFRDWEPVPRARVEEAEDRVHGTCNAILTARGLPPLASLRDLFTVDAQFLITVPELDYFEARARDPAQRYYGALAPAAHGQPAQWPAGTEPAVFAYVRGEYGAVEQALKTLAERPWRVLAFTPGAAPALVTKYSSRRMLIVTEPVDMTEVCNTCNAVVCNSGSGTVTTVLHAGKPLVMLPLHLEQFLIARRIESMGAGLVVHEQRIEGLGDAVERVLAQPSFREAALAFSRRYQNPSGNQVADTIATRCIELALSGARARPSAGHGKKHHSKHQRR